MIEFGIRHLPKGITRRGTGGGENGGGQDVAIRTTHDLKRGTHVTNEAHRIGDLWLEGDLGRAQQQIGVWRRRLPWFGLEAESSDGVSVRGLAAVVEKWDWRRSKGRERRRFLVCIALLIEFMAETSLWICRD